MYNVRFALLFPVAMAFAAALSPQMAQAQSASNYSSGNQWGTAPSGVAVAGAADSAITHAQDSAVAGAVNAARDGLLLGTGLGGISIYSIGTQTVVSNTIVGNNNGTTINSSQDATNSGGVSNNGTINAKINTP